MKTKSDDELIAEFMGEPLTFIHDTGIETVERKIDYKGYYHEWSNLMEVVEKIETLGYDNAIFHDGTVPQEFQNEMRIYQQPGTTVVRIRKTAKTKTQAVYSAVVEFIKLYNPKSCQSH